MSAKGASFNLFDILHQPGFPKAQRVPITIFGIERCFEVIFFRLKLGFLNTSTTNKYFFQTIGNFDVVSGFFEP